MKVNNLEWNLCHKKVRKGGDGQAASTHGQEKRKFSCCLKWMARDTALGHEPCLGCFDLCLTPIAINKTSENKARKGNCKRCEKRVRQLHFLAVFLAFMWTQRLKGQSLRSWNRVEHWGRCWPSALANKSLFDRNCFCRVKKDSTAVISLITTIRTSARYLSQAWILFCFISAWHCWDYASRLSYRFFEKVASDRTKTHSYVIFAVSNLGVNNTRKKPKFILWRWLVEKTRFASSFKVLWAQA